MTPARRIRRIQRWIAKLSGTEFRTPAAVVVHFYGVNDDDRNWSLISEQLEHADRLFAAELTWLCEYAAILNSIRSAELHLDALDPPHNHRVTEYGT